jgi:hypothetical protein
MSITTRTGVEAIQAEVLQLCRSGRISWADMVLAPSVAGLFKWRQFEPEMILLAVGWYLRFSLSYRDVEELFAERDLRADHVTVWRWVQRYTPEIQRRLRPQLRPSCSECVWHIFDRLSKYTRRRVEPGLFGMRWDP